MHNSDVGFEKHSPRDARFMEFVAKGPGIAGFKFEVDPEVDGDAAAQFLAQADKARVEEGDFRVSARHPRELSFEALTDLGMEFTDPDAEEAFAAMEDVEEVRDLPAHLVAQFDESRNDEDNEDGEGAIAALDPKYLQERQPGAISTFRSAEVVAQATAGRRQGVLRWNTAACLRRMVETARFVFTVERSTKAEADRKTAEAKKAATATANKPEPPKGNGNGHAAPTRTFLKGTVMSHGQLGMTVKTDDGTEIRVALDDERGHGSKTAAAKWLFSHKVGKRVRVRMIRANGYAYGVLDTHHRRPEGWLPPSQRRQPAVGKEVNQQIEAPAAN